MIAARKVRATDGAGKEHVADESQAMLAAEEHHMPRRVARTEIDFQRFIAELNSVTVVQPAIEVNASAFANPKRCVCAGS